VLGVKVLKLLGTTDTITNEVRYMDEGGSDSLFVCISLSRRVERLVEETVDFVCSSIIDIFDGRPRSDKTTHLMLELPQQKGKHKTAFSLVNFLDTGILQDPFHFSMVQSVSLHMTEFCKLPAQNVGLPCFGMRCRKSRGHCIPPTLRNKEGLSTAALANKIDNRGRLMSSRVLLYYHYHGPSVVGANNRSIFTDSCVWVRTRVTCLWCSTDRGGPPLFGAAIPPRVTSSSSSSRAPAFNNHISTTSAPKHVAPLNVRRSGRLGLVITSDGRGGNKISRGLSPQTITALYSLRTHILREHKDVLVSFSVDDVSGNVHATISDVGSEVVPLGSENGSRPSHLTDNLAHKAAPGSTWSFRRITNGGKVLRGEEVRCRAKARAVDMTAGNGTTHVTDTTLSHRKRAKVKRAVERSDTSVHSRGTQRVHYYGHLGCPVSPEDAGRSSLPLDHRDAHFSAAENLQAANALIDEYEDVSVEEKAFMKLWNIHTSSFHLFGERYLPHSCRYFALKFGQVLLEKNLRTQFLCHLVHLHDFGLMSLEDMKNCMSLVPASESPALALPINGGDSAHRPSR